MRCSHGYTRVSMVRMCMQWEHCAHCALVRFIRNESRASCDGEQCELGWDCAGFGVTGVRVIAVPHRNAFMLDVVYHLAGVDGSGDGEYHVMVGTQYEVLDDAFHQVALGEAHVGRDVVCDAFLIDYYDVLVFLRTTSRIGFDVELSTDSVLGVVDSLVRLSNRHGDNNVQFAARDAGEMFPMLAEHQKKRLTAECHQGIRYRNEHWNTTMGISNPCEHCAHC